jgi:chromosomal replication initiator protein
MGRPAQRTDRDGLESFHHQQNVECSRSLLNALKTIHGEPDPFIIEEPVILPPIPDKLIARAANFAFPRVIMNRVEAIQRATLTEFPNLTIQELRSQRRTAVVVRARQIAMYLAKKLTGQSLPEIGRRFGDRDHSTVLHAVRKIETLLIRDTALVLQIQRIKDMIPEASA